MFSPQVVGVGHAKVSKDAKRMACSQGLAHPKVDAVRKTLNIQSLCATATAIPTDVPAQAPSRALPDAFKVKPITRRGLKALSK